MVEIWMWWLRFGPPSDMPVLFQFYVNDSSQDCWSLFMHFLHSNYMETEQVAVCLLNYFLLCLQWYLVLEGSAEGPSNKTTASKEASHGGSGSVIGARVVIVLLGLLAVVAFSVFLFKIWQKKKREEQHARLLKLFEDDDELEVELGIRDWDPWSFFYLKFF